MKRLIAILMVLAGSMFLTTVATADDADDVKRAVLAVDAAYNRGDVEAIAKYMHPEHSRFPAGQLLVEGFSKEGPKAFFDSGIKINVQARHLGVKIYGNTAVVTGYSNQTSTLPDGTVNQSTVRFTEVWIKEKSKWLRVHIHQSPLNPQQ